MPQDLIIWVVVIWFALFLLLGQHVATLDGLGADEQLAIVIYMLNTNPVDLPDLPTQLVVSATKQDGTELRSAVISAAEFADRVTVREY